MADDFRPGKEDKAVKTEQRFTREVQRKMVRKRRGMNQRDRSVWFGLGMFGLIGWAVAVPTLAGIALGWWIDSTWPSRVSWTLTFLFVGVVVGCWNAWYWIRHEHERD